nr:hypothetical protein [Gemmatimonadaceae bacterium]
LLLRDAPSAADSAWATAGGTLVTWSADSASDGTRRTSTPDTIGGIVVDGRAALFMAVRTHAPPAGRVIARWIDGEPAVTEQAQGAGCIRAVSVMVPAAGDVTLRPSFQDALRVLMRPCMRSTAEPIADSTRALLAGSGPLALAGVLRASSSRSAATPWLLAAALLLLLVELVVRRSNAAEPSGMAS